MGGTMVIHRFDLFGAYGSERSYKELACLCFLFGQERLKVDEGALAEVLREEGVEEMLEASNSALESSRSMTIGDRIWLLNWTRCQDTTMQDDWISIYIYN